jgi:NAD(P)H-dependent FMN reductase
MGREILLIVGSASRNSANLKLVHLLAEAIPKDYAVSIFEDLKSLPHFDVEQSSEGAPDSIVAFRKSIEEAAGVIICTPEYVFSIPSGLKNAIEWCVATTVFSDKPVGLITASADGEKGHEELQLLMRTLTAQFTTETTLLIRGIKSKFSAEGVIEKTTYDNCMQLVKAFLHLVPST